MNIKNNMYYEMGVLKMIIVENYAGINAFNPEKNFWVKKLTKHNSEN